MPQTLRYAPDTIVVGRIVNPTYYLTKHKPTHLGATREHTTITTS